jgi:hypothetical protein
MRTLYHLRELAWISNQYDIPRRARHRKQIGKTDLSRFVNEEPIKSLYDLRSRKEKGRPANDACG